MRGRRGFSFPEIMIAIVITSMIALVAVGSFAVVRRNVYDRAAAPVLVSAQLEARRALDAAGAFPEDLVLWMSPLPSIGYVAGLAGPGQVSVLRVDGTAVVFAAPGAKGCLVLLDRIGSAPTWGYDSGGVDRCDAASAWLVIELLEGGTADQPLEASIP